MLKKDLQIMLRSKGIWILVFLVLIIFMISASFSKEKDEVPAAVRIGVVDLDESEYSKMLLGFFEGNEVFSSYAAISKYKEAEAKELFLRGDLDMYLVIPKSFAQNLISIQNTPIKAVINTADTTKSLMFQNLLNAYETYISSVQTHCATLMEVMRAEGMDEAIIADKNIDISYDLIFTALGKDRFFERIELERFQSISLLQYYSYAGIFLILLYGGLFAGMSLLNEHRQGILSRLRSAGGTAAAVISSKLLMFGGIYGFFVAVFCLIAMVFGFFIVSLFHFCALLLSIICSIMLFILLSAFFRKMQTYLLVSNMAILLFTILGGGIIPFMYLPQAMIKFAYLTPNYWFLRIMLQLENGSGSLGLTLLFLAMLLLSFLLFAASVVLYGRREEKAYAGA